MTSIAFSPWVLALGMPHFANDMPPQEVFAWPGSNAVWTDNEHLGRADAQVYRRARRQTIHALPHGVYHPTVFVAKQAWRRQWTGKSARHL